MIPGYKLRQQISKSLQWRSEAIRKAIARYNIQAAALNPPWPPISWKDITQYTFLGEFNLLWHTRDDVRERVWAKLAVREVTAKFFKLCCAKEEITRLNVEMRHLRAAIHNEEREVSHTYANLCETQPLLALKLKRFHLPHAVVNTLHLHHLDQIEKQYGLVQVGNSTRAQVYHPHNESVTPPAPISQDDNLPTLGPINLDENLSSTDTHSVPTGFQDEFVHGKGLCYLLCFCLICFCRTVFGL